jgi:hypothetical protein
MTGFVAVPCRYERRRQPDAQKGNNFVARNAPELIKAMFAVQKWLAS